MTLSLANSVEDVEPGCSGCNTHSDSESESSNKFRFSDFKDVKLMTGHPAANIAFTNSPYATIGDTFNIRIGTANIDGQEFKNITSFNNQIPCENNERITFCNRLSRYACLYGVVSFFAVGLLIVVPFLTRTTLTTRPPPDKILTTTIATTVPLPTNNSPSKDNLVKRATWAALEVKERGLNISVPQKLMKVFVTHTGGKSCYSFKECSEEVRKIQKMDMKDSGLRDIRYNFLIGGDERVYEGRGWGFYRGKSEDMINVAFIGNVEREMPTTRMFIKAYFFINCAKGELYNTPCLMAPENIEWLASWVNFCGILSSENQYCCNSYEYCNTVDNITYNCSN